MQSEYCQHDTYIQLNLAWYDDQLYHSEVVLKALFYPKDVAP